MKKSGLTVVLAMIGGLVTAAFAALVATAAYFFNMAYRREEPKKKVKLNGSEDEETMKEKPDVIRHDQMILEAEEWIDAHNLCDFCMTAEDGLKLHARMIFAEGESKKLAILVHGFRARCEIDFCGIMQFYHEQGFHVLLLDDRAHGESEGTHLGFGWLDRRDLVKWSKELCSVLGSDVQIILHGVSMGAAAVMCASGEEDLPKQVKGIIEDCGFSSQENQFLYSFPENLKPISKIVIGLAGVIGKFVNGYSIKEASTLEQLKKNHRPMLFIHGCADTFVPFNMVYDNYAATQGPKMLYCVPDSEHALNFVHDPAKYKEKMMEFFDSVL